MAELLYRLGRLAARRARTVIAVWFAVLALAATTFALAGGTLASTVSIPGTPTADVTDRLQAALPEVSGGTGTIVVTAEDGGRLTGAQRSALSALVAEAAETPGVAQVVDPFATEAQRVEQRLQIEQGRAQLEAQQASGQVDPAQLAAQGAQLELGSALLEMSAELRTVSADRTAALVTVVFTESLFDVVPETKEAVIDLFEAAEIDGVAMDFSADLSAGLPSVFGVGEVIGLLVAAVVLVVMLGTFVGAGLPLLTALIGVGIGALGALSLSGAVEMVSVTPVLGIMLGLAVGIDYALFIVNRHRRQLTQGYELSESIGLANGTSGNAVVFAGSTVLIALLALNVTGIPFLGLMGTVGAMCVLVAVLIAVTLTPALLGLIGERILSARERGRATTPADPPAAPATGTMSTPRALARVAAGVLGLLVLAVPATSLRLGLPDGSAEAEDSTQYAAYTTVAERFGPGQNSGLLVVADLPPSASEEEGLLHQFQVAEQLFAQDDVVAVAPVGVSEDGSIAAFQVVPAEGPSSVSTEELVHHLRDLSPLEGGVTIAVAGQASGNIDISEKLSDALPGYLGVVVGLSLVIMIGVFRSIFVPVIATVGFILSYFAAVGAVVAIYQWGWLGQVFGVHDPGPILSFLPTILVGVLFGLAMDYMLFIGSGMREAYAHGATARAAVVQGVRAGRSVVTAAAIIMVSVFGGFVFAESAIIRPIGFALAFGVLVDAFVVRMWLVPALMHLAGDRAWWLPRWLDRILPDVDVEGSALERRHHHDDGADQVDDASAVRSSRVAVD